MFGINFVDGQSLKLKLVIYVFSASELPQPVNVTVDQFGDGTDLQVKWDISDSNKVTNLVHIYYSLFRTIWK